MMEDSQTFDFELGKKLGEGSYGRVHECTVKNIGQCAVKILKKSSNGVISPLEMSIMATYRHPNLTHAIKISHDKNYFYIIQDAAVCDLDEYLKKGEQFDKPAWFIQMLQGLQFLHSENIIHCDLKPSNVLVMSDGSVKLTDYSHSTLIIENNTHFRRKIGSPRYSAPEVLAGELWSKPVDVWSLGCVFYEVSTKNKFLETVPSRAGDKDLYTSIITGTFIKTILQSDDKELILDCMLQVNPKDRYTCKEILDFYFCQKNTEPYQIVVLNKAEKTEAKSILPVISRRFTCDKNILKLAEKINSRTAEIPSSLVKLEACFILASKILVGSAPFTMIMSPLREILLTELKICINANFLLHI